MKISSFFTILGLALFTIYMSLYYIFDMDLGFVLGPIFVGSFLLSTIFYFIEIPKNIPILSFDAKEIQERFKSGTPFQKAIRWIFNPFSVLIAIEIVLFYLLFLLVGGFDPEKSFGVRILSGMDSALRNLLGFFVLTLFFVVISVFPVSMLLMLYSLFLKLKGEPHKRRVILSNRLSREFGLVMSIYVLNVLIFVGIGFLSELFIAELEEFPLLGLSNNNLIRLILLIFFGSLSIKAYLDLSYLYALNPKQPVTFSNLLNFIKLNFGSQIVVASLSTSIWIGVIMFAITTIPSFLVEIFCLAEILISYLFFYSSVFQTIYPSDNPLQISLLHSI